MKPRMDCCRIDELVKDVGIREGRLVRLNCSLGLLALAQTWNRSL